MNVRIDYIYIYICIYIHTYIHTHTHTHIHAAFHQISRLILKQTPQLLIVGDFQDIMILLESENAQVQRTSKERADCNVVVCNH